MGKIAVLPKGDKCLEANQAYLSDKPMPDFYMGDYSILGLLVEKFEDAVRLLRENGYAIERKKSGVEVGIANPVHIKNIFQIFHENRLRFEMEDIVAQVYQG